MKKLWLPAALVIVGIFMYLFAARLDKLREENVRLTENNSILHDQRNHLADGFARTVKLTEQEFDREYGSLVDSLDKVSKEKIKVDRVLALTEFRLKHTRRDVRIAWMDSLVYDTVSVGRKLLFTDSCMKFKLYEPNNPDSVGFAIVSGEVDINADIIFYEGKRRKQVKVFGLNLFRYGKRESDAKMFSNCGTINLRTLEVQR